MDQPARTTWNFWSAGRLIFGKQALQELGPALRRMKVERVLVICDRPIVDAGILNRCLENLRRSRINAEVFSDGEPEPSLTIAGKAVEKARQAALNAVIGLGGGSNMDLAKICSVILTHGGTFSDYFGFDKIPGPILPVICVPTTAGTGSEVSAAAVLSDTAQKLKVSTLSPYLRAALAVVDPELTHSCPKRPTAASGIDALTHAIEGYVATHSSQIPIGVGELFAYEGKNPLADALAEKAIRSIGKHLTTAVEKPSDSAAREGMSLAATMAGLAFSNSAVALVHAMEYPVGGAVHVSHGDGNGLLLPYVMRFELSARENEFAQVAEWLGVDTKGLTMRQAAEAAVTAVEGLRTRIGIPTRLRDLGVRREQLAEFAAKAFGIERLMILTPRRPTREDILGIYEQAW